MSAAGRLITIRFDTPHCSCGKRTFTEAEARKQLAQAQQIRATHGSNKQGRVETRVYECTPGMWHLTAEPKRKRR